MDEKQEFEGRYSRESLVAALRQRGVSYLAPSDAVACEALESSEQLLTALLCQNDSRLRLAMIPLLLRQPELADCMPALTARLHPDLALELQTLYMAAVYLQRNWLSRLRLYLNSMELLPDLFSRQLGLPPPDERFGRTGLYALAEAWKARSAYPFARLEALNSTIDLFFEQLKIEARDQAGVYTN